jgi:hypothetical protein
LHDAQFDGGMHRVGSDHEEVAMGQVEACRTIDRQNKTASEIIGPLARWHVGAIVLAGTMMIAGAIVAFSSVDASARPQYVTKSKPCGSCHPPNNPPKKK